MDEEKIKCDRCSDETKVRDWHSHQKSAHRERKIIGPRQPLELEPRKESDDEGK